ncbi:MAG: putative Ig domain-containing protein [Acidobacteria bacterium]|nr:putative Ig domain-containing protein [Acidobacteriota bacterium]
MLCALAVLGVLLGSAAVVEAQTTITLAWDANTESDIGGYEVSYGTQSGVYSTIVDVGNVTSQPFTIASGGVYYFAVKAYNSSSPRQYSPYSLEVSTGVVTNRPPTLTQPANQTSAEHTSISLQLVASDPDLNPLTYGATGLPAALAINATTGLISGTLTYTSAGSYMVTATVSDGALTNSQTFAWTVTDVAKPTPAITWANAAAITYGTALSGIQLNATASVAGTFVYSPAAGTTLTAGTQALSVTFTPTDTVNYSSASKSVTIDVAKATPVVTWATPASVVAGSVLGATQLNATANVAGTFVYSPAAGTTLTAGTQTLSVTFTPTDTVNYTTANSTVTLTVTAIVKTTPVITWANAAAITYGTPLSSIQLNATADVAGTFVYNPVAGTVLNKGTRTLSVVFTPADTVNYTTATKTVTIDVTRAAPVVRWPKPKSIAQGTALSSTELNATVDTTVTGAARSNGAARLDGTSPIAGTFVYAPSAGTVLALGSHTLSVTFMPTDGDNYSPAMASTNLAVLTEEEAAANQIPFGAFDTPADGTTRMQGSFALTGWALDDVGIDRVEIWRDLAAGEDPTHAYTTDPSHPAHGKVFIANPFFVKNSRTDVEALYPDYPFANRAGWGYLLMSRGLHAQGNGTYTLYAFAFDVDGHSASLGTKTITVDNARAAKPFGAIDTPGYGETMTGTFYNFGWALTPAGPSSCRIENGGVSVSIDSGPLAPAMYGDARSDIAAAFPDLLNSANASGAFAVDTKKLSNGMHQIGWLVTDNCGRQEGVGSRFFNVLNGSARGAGSDPAAGLVSGRSAGSDQTVGAQLIAPDQDAALAARPSSAPLPAIEETVGVRQLGSDWQDVQLDDEGRYVIDVAQGGRIEVQLPLAESKYAGFHEVQEQHRLLPLGSSFDAKAGVFYWQPDAAFLGSYDLVFEVPGTGAVRVRVVVK